MSNLFFTGDCSCFKGRTYPNLELEAILRIAGHSDTYCQHAKVSKEVFKDVLDGNDTFSYEEKEGIIRTYNFIYNYDRIVSWCFREYIFNSHLSCYDLNKPKHFRKFRILYSELNELMKNLVGVVEEDVFLQRCYIPWEELQKFPCVTRAHYNILLYTIGAIKNKISIRKKSSKIRTRRRQE